MTYLLDTNAIISLLNRTDSQVYSQLLKYSAEEVVTSSIVIYELYYGAYKSRRKKHNLGIVEKLRFPVLDFSRDDAQEAGDIRAYLEQQGTPIGALDLLIAGQARSRKMILVTRNIREFERVINLKIESWE